MQGKPIMLAICVAAAVVQAPPALAGTSYTYQCRDGAELVLQEANRMAYVELDGQRLSLPQRLSLSGHRYSKGGVSITTKGRLAILKRGRTKTECEVVRTY